MTSRVRTAIVDENAANWDARLRSHDCSAEERERFNIWLNEDPRHVEAFNRLQAVLSSLREASEHPQLRALREAARVAERRSAHLRMATQWSLAAGVAALVLAIAYWSWTWRKPLMPPIMAGSEATAVNSVLEGTGELVTGLRERRTVALPDGTSATLNASTRLQTEWLPHERRIRLVAGQALFRVAKDKTRPFIVTAGDRTVTAVGTAFDVRLDADKVQVTLLEGQVAVKGLGSASNQPTLELRPSQQLIAIGGAPPTVRAVNVETASAWAEGQVFFTDEALPVAVAEMNQYSAQQVVAGPELCDYRVNGMFRAGNQDGFVGALTSYFPIDAHRDNQGRLVLERRREMPQGH